MSDKPEALKPCPFCNGEAIVITECQTWVECADCSSKASIGPFNTKAEAIAAWNQRSASDSALADEAPCDSVLCEELDAAIDALHAAILQPKGVVPAEAERFYNPNHRALRSNAGKASHE